MISVLLAVYNGEKYLQKSIQSLLDQSYSHFEILIGFNGTTDNSKNIVKSFHDSRIKIFDYDNEKGKAKTLNKLILESQYDWCAIQDDDDIWMPQKIETQKIYMNTYDIIGTHINYINEEDIIIGKPNLAIYHNDIISDSKLGHNQIANTSAVFKKKDAIEVNCWNETLDGIEDFDFWLKLMKNQKVFVNIPECLVYHRLHQNSNFNTKTYNLSKLYYDI